MKYVCLVHFDETLFDTLPREDYDTLARDSNDYGERFRKDGQLLAAHILGPAWLSTLVRAQRRQRDAQINDQDRRTSSFALLCLLLHAQEVPGTSARD